MRFRAFLWLPAAVVFALVLFEVTMKPTAMERNRLGAIFLALMGVAALAVYLLPRWSTRARSIRFSIVAVGMISFLIVAGTAIAAAQEMFFSSHDLQLLLVVLGFGLVASFGFAFAVSRPITSDLRRIAATAQQVAGGDFTATTKVNRADEVGALAVAFDAMAVNLSLADQRRQDEDEARREFLTAVGHDLRSPLGSLQAAVEALQDGVAPDPVRYLGSMERDIGALHRLVDDIFLLARLEAGAVELQLQSVDVTEIADEAIEVLRPTAQRLGVNVELQAPGSITTDTAPEALGRVMRNLIDNAIRHSKSTVVVSLATSPDLVVRVTDDGAGFPADFVGRAFESFTRADAARTRDGSGTGLGLAIAHRFVTALGGSIHAEPGPGGAVEFSLPG
ncbi:MAG: HAMP domain-containing sensor histidine kinase [Acidimicrobiia bacterium]|nr:HAMP domain-containing sensor histidine kinase [Acidimicrobiia bacterium]MDX2467988.1 HAMP domain-containing sensor histidine kinase [Acidimicrobiia bacterium]